MTDLKKISLITLFLAGTYGSHVLAMEGEGEGQRSAPHRLPHSEALSTDAMEPGAPEVHGAPPSSVAELEAQVRAAQFRAELERQNRIAAEETQKRKAAEAETARIAREMREKAEDEQKRQRQEEEAKSRATFQTGARPTPAPVLPPPPGRLGSRLQQLARAPRPPAGSSKGDVVVHNISVEGARAVQGVQKVAHKVGRAIGKLF